jgi:hypothetical protein
MPDGAKISEERLIECRASARLWASHLKEYSDKMQDHADRYTITATLISTITGLTAWGTIAASPRLWAQALVGLMAFATAAVAVIPKVKGYGDRALELASPASQYGKVLGGLLDATPGVVSDSPDGQAVLRAALSAFENTKNEKDRQTLTGLQEIIDRDRPNAIRAEEASVAALKAELQKKAA